MIVDTDKDSNVHLDDLIKILSNTSKEKIDNLVESIHMSVTQSEREKIYNKVKGILEFRDNTSEVGLKKDDPKITLIASYLALEDKTIQLMKKYGII